MAAIATRKIVASDMAPTATPSIGTGNASATEAAATKTATPATSRQPKPPEASDAPANARPTAAARATESHTDRVDRELASSRTEWREKALNRAGPRALTW